MKQENIYERGPEERLEGTLKDLERNLKDNSEEQMAGSCCQTTLRTEKEQQDLIHRLNRIEGQIRGIRGMLEKDAYCIDILNQVSAANCALNSFTKVLLTNHIRRCVAEDVRDGHDEKLEELVKTLQKLMK